jgi:hypothetical protein
MATRLIRQQPKANHLSSGAKTGLIVAGVIGAAAVVGTAIYLYSKNSASPPSGLSSTSTSSSSSSSTGSGCTGNCTAPSDCACLGSGVAWGCHNGSCYLPQLQSITPNFVSIDVVTNLSFTSTCCDPDIPFVSPTAKYCNYSASSGSGTVTVLARDQNGNAMPGITIDGSLALGNPQYSSLVHLNTTSVTTNSAGQASFTVTVDSNIYNYFGSMIPTCAGSGCGQQGSYAQTAGPISLGQLNLSESGGSLSGSVLIQCSVRVVCTNTQIGGCNCL